MKILVLGAGGLGCEILKNIYLMPFVSNITLIDFDTIELSNLNRQFLFSDDDIGKYKATVAASFINRLKNNQNFVVPLITDINKLSLDFLTDFDLVISGLDAIQPRRYINSQLVQLTYSTNFEKCVPFIDSACEGFKGHLKIIIPGITACWECTISTLPSQETNNQKFPLCTIASRPRNLNHVIQYILLTDEVSSSIDEIIIKSKKRAIEFNIDYSEINEAYVYGIIHNTIPSTASSNAFFAAKACIIIEKLYNDTFDFDNGNTFYIGSLEDGVYFYGFQAEINQNCIVCNKIQKTD